MRYIFLNTDNLQAELQNTQDYLDKDTRLENNRVLYFFHVLYYFILCVFIATNAKKHFIGYV